MKFPIPYRKNNKWGFCNKSKVILIECIYDEIVIPFSNNNFQLALVKRNGKSSWITTKGEKKSPDADTINSFTPKGISVIILDDENFNSLNSRKNCLFIDSSGKSVFEIESITCGGFQNDICIVFFPNKKYGAINTLGEIIIEAKYDKYEDVWNEIGRPMKYDNNSSHYPENEEYLDLFVENNFFGFKDKAGQIVIKPKYIYASSFYRGFSVVSVNKGEVFHIDTRGERLYPQSYYFVSGFEFEDYIAKVVTDRLNIDPSVHTRWGVDYYIPDGVNWGYIDVEGNEYWEN